MQYHLFFFKTQRNLTQKKKKLTCKLKRSSIVIGIPSLFVVLTALVKNSQPFNVTASHL